MVDYLIWYFPSPQEVNKIAQIPPHWISMDPKGNLLPHNPVLFILAKSNKQEYEEYYRRNGFTGDFIYPWKPGYFYKVSTD